MIVNPKEKESIFIDILCLHQDLFPALCKLNISDKASVAEFRKSNSPCVCLFVNDNLKKFYNNDLFMIRGSKHSKKTLSYYFIDNDSIEAKIRKPVEKIAIDKNGIKGEGIRKLKETDKIRLIDGKSFKKAGSLRTGIKAFINNKKLTNPFLFVGIEQVLFDSVMTRKNTKMAVINTQELPVKDPLLNQAEHISYPEALDEWYIGQSVNCVKVKHLISVASQNDFPVLIIGATGTGKELVASAIHNYSRDRRSGSFIAINCAAIPDYLFESEIFGHKKGAFTGALTDKIGLWEVADKGTLFLDEIGDLSLRHQVKILRALTEGYFYRVGDTIKRYTDTRIITATNKNLYGMLDTDVPQFRDDLYYRLANLTIRTPSLNEHPEDIPVLANVFWQKISKNDYACLPQDVIARLKEGHFWRGNVRELKYFVEKLYLFNGTNIAVENVNALYEEELRNLLYAPLKTGENRNDSNDVDHIIEAVERLLKIAKKTKDPESKSDILRKIARQITISK